MSVSEPLQTAGSFSDKLGDAGSVGFDKDNRLVFYVSLNDDVRWFAAAEAGDGEPVPLSEQPKELSLTAPGGAVEAMQDPYDDGSGTRAREIYLRFPGGYTGQVDEADPGAGWLVLKTDFYIGCIRMSWLTASSLLCEGVDDVRIVDVRSATADNSMMDGDFFDVPTPRDLLSDNDRSNRDFLLSPDRASITFVSERDNAFALYSMPATPGAEPTLVAQLPGEYRLTRWVGAASPNTTTPITTVDVEVGAPCIEAFSGGSSSNVDIFGGVETNYDRVASLYQMCQGFGVSDSIQMSVGFQCAVVAVYAHIAAPAVGELASGACDALTVQDMIEGNTSYWAGSTDLLCGALGRLFATASGIIVAGSLSATGPGAVAIGVGAYKAIDAFLELSCPALLNGDASAYGYNRESKHLANVRSDILMSAAKCLRQRERIGVIRWSAVRCA